MAHPAEITGVGQVTEVRAAIVVATGPGPLTVVGGLPLGARAVLALHAAGIPHVAVLAGAGAPRLRAVLDRRPLGAAVAWLEGPADLPALELPDRVLVLTGDLLFDGAALAPLLAAVRPDEHRVVRASAGTATAARAAVCPRALVPALLAALADGRHTLGEALLRVGGLDGPAVALREGLAVPLEGAPGPAALERALLDHLAGRTTVADSYLAALVDRRLSRPITRLLLRSPLSPSQITLASILVGLAGAAGLATPSYGGRLAGVVGLIVSIVLDCVDGEVARARFEQSAAGARLDLFGDYAVHLAVFVGLGVGLARQGLTAAGTWAAIALVAGVAAAMATVHGWLVRPALAGGGDLHWTGGGAGLRGSRVGTVVEKLASRDYTYLLLVFALLGHLEWFLYAAAVGSWLFVGGLLACVGYQRAAPRRPAVVE